MGIIFTVILFIVILIIVSSSLSPSKNDLRNLSKTVAANFEKSDLLSYDTTNHTLAIKNRFSGIASVLDIEDHVNTVTMHKPTEYIYTSATVGGITTGGVTKIGGYDYLASTGKSGKCILVYGGNNPVFSIQLPDELLEEAQKSEIKEYVNSDGTITVIKRYEPWGIEADALKEMAQNGNTSAVADILARRAEYPTREKCNKILNWLSKNE